MGENNCPCEALVVLQGRVDKLEERADKQNENAKQLEVSLVAIQKDLEYIKDKVAKSSKFNGNVLNSIINAIIVIIMTYIAVRLGLA